jgi:hypothetical protein
LIQYYLWLAWWKNECDEYDLGMMMGACVIVVMMG